MRQDVLHALRGFRRTPGFTIAVLLVLALGIGANTAIFSVVNAVLFQPLPFHDPARLVMVWERIPSFGPSNTGASQADFFDFRRENRAFQEIAAFRGEDVNFFYSTDRAGTPQRIKAARVSWTLFPVLGVAPRLGRVFTEDEDSPGPNRVVVLSHGAWMTRFHGDAGIVGKQIQLDSVAHTVIGVMPKGFEFPFRNARFDGAELWSPIAFTKAELKNRGDSFNTSLVARLKPGVSIAQAAEDADRVAVFIHSLYPKSVQEFFTLRGTATSLEEEFVGNVRAAMWILLAAVGMVLLIGCANVANLLLVRATSRRREMAIRAALGADRARLIRQSLTESILLSSMGGLLGMALAVWSLGAIVRLAPGNVPRLEEARLDPLVFGFAALVSVLTGVLFGLAPALASSGADVSAALKDGGRSGSARSSRLRSALIVGEVALSMVLLTGAGLLLKSFARLQGVDPGFDRGGVLTFSTALPDVQYANGSDVRALYRDVVDRLGSLPGVIAAAGGSSLPLRPALMIMFTPEDQASGKWGKTIARNTMVEGDYFRALGIRLREGRYLGPLDGKEAPLAVVINETMAKKFWPGGSPIGRRLRWGSPQGSAPWLTIVGVVGDVKQDGLDRDTPSAIYMPLSQTGDRGGIAIRSANFAIRTMGDPRTLIEATRKQLAAVDPELPFYDAQTAEETVQLSTAPRRFPLLLVGLFASLALILATVGLYGVMSYTVSQYTQEIGVRMALGASTGSVLSMILRQGMQWVLVGLSAGLGGAWAVTRWLESLLFGVGTRDPWVFGAVSAMLMLVTLAACWLPARRATRIDPITALRQE